MSPIALFFGILFLGGSLGLLVGLNIGFNRVYRQMASRERNGGWE